jgi:hypothetical protein
MSQESPHDGWQWCALIIAILFSVTTCHVADVWKDVETKRMGSHK